MSEKSLPLIDRVRQQTVTIGTSPAKLPDSPLSGRRLLIIQNLSATAVVYLGASDVATSGTARGIALPTRYDSLTIEASNSVDLYGISTQASTDVSIMEWF